MPSRRTFLFTLPLLLAPRMVRALPLPRARPRAGRDGGPRHPEPRAGITAGRVLPDSVLRSPDAIAVFALARQIPQVLDGIRCSCGCAGTTGYYSLLTCFEEVGMAQHCEICQGQAKLAFKLHRAGWSLAGIRRSIDSAYAE